MFGTILGGIIGGVAGFLIGGVAGAVAGAIIGASIGSSIQSGNALVGSSNTGTVNVVKKDTSSITVSYSLPISSSIIIKWYIYHKRNLIFYSWSNAIEVDANVISYTIGNLNSNKSYKIRVKAEIQGGPTQYVGTVTDSTN